LLLLLLLRVLLPPLLLRVLLLLLLRALLLLRNSLIDFTDLEEARLGVGFFFSRKVLALLFRI
jgi:hypothetical protein